MVLLGIRMNKFKIILMLMLLLMLPLHAWAGEAEREAMLDTGLKSNEAYSLSLLEKAATAEKEKKIELLQEAISHSPEVPGFYFELAWALLPDAIKSFDNLFLGVNTYAKNFWWRRSMLGLLYTSALLSLSVALALMALIRFPIELKYIVHDINENLKKFIIPVVLVLISFTSPLFCIASALMLTGMYAKKMQKSGVYIMLCLILLSPVLLKYADEYYSSSTPALRAMAAVNTGTDNVFATEVLKGEEDFGPRFSYALALKREGRINEAISVYKGLLEADTGAKVFTNLANAYVAAGKMSTAKSAYKEALEIEPSATLYYNMSQVYRGTYDVDAGNKYFDEAAKLDSNLVSAYSAMASSNPNRFVIDQTLSEGELKEFAREHTETVISPFHLPVYLSAFLAAAMMVMFIVMDKNTVNRAHSCPDCGKVICPLCARKENVGGRCEECYKLYKEDTSPQGRVKRMLKSKERKNKIMGRIRILSILFPPGMAQIYSGRQFSGLLILWIALFCIAAVVINPLFSTGLDGFGHMWLIMPAALIFIFIYFVSVLSVARRLSKGWL
jgi:tetratricopeptide (TPR) repeat protein